MNSVKLDSFLSKEQLLPLIKDNIEKFDPVFLSGNGGWPSFENLDISLISKSQASGRQCYKLMLFYECITGSSCFMADNRREQSVCFVYIKNGTILKIK